MSILMFKVVKLLKYLRLSYICFYSFYSILFRFGLLKVCKCKYIFIRIDLNIWRLTM